MIKNNNKMKLNDLINLRDMDGEEVWLLISISSENFRLVFFSRKSVYLFEIEKIVHFGV